MTHSLARFITERARDTNGNSVLHSYPCLGSVSHLSPK